MSMQVETNESALPLQLTVDQLGLGGVTGLVPTVALRNITMGTPRGYLDWHSMTFRTSGWGLKYQPMFEVEHGHYEVIVNIAVLQLPVGTKLAAEYHVDNGNGIVGDDADILDIVATGQGVTILRKGFTNRMEEYPGNPGQLALFDDDGLTILARWQIRDSAGGGVVAPPGAPARRSAKL